MHSISQIMFDIKYRGVVAQSDGSYLYDNNIIWYNDKGQYHKEDGPAIIRQFGGSSWYLNDAYYTFDEWCIEMNKTDEEKMLLRLQYV
jgi:hypothetical protein